MRTRRLIRSRSLRFWIAVKTEVRYNWEWLDKLGYYDMVKLMDAKFTVSQMLEREDFHKRFQE